MFEENPFRGMPEPAPGGEHSAHLQGILGEDRGQAHSLNAEVELTSLTVPEPFSEEVSCVGQFG